MTVKKAPIILIILLSITILGASGAYIAHRLTAVDTDDITIIANQYTVGLWTDEAQTTLVNGVTFPDIIEGDLTGSTVSISTVYYLAPNVSTMDQTLYVLVNATGIPSGMTLEAQIRTNSLAEWFIITVNDSGYDASFTTPSGQRQLRFLLDIGDNGVGTYPGSQIEFYGCGNGV